MLQHNNLRILIIDDNPAIHQDFIKTLTKSSPGKDKLASFEKALFGKENVEKISLPRFQIDTAAQGQEGVERIAKSLQEKNPYALAFVDIRMPPGWDGIETIKHIWQLAPDIQIVICTAYSDYSWEDTVEQLGQRENLLILKKPFDGVAVRQLSCALTKKWQLLQEARDYTAILEMRVEERTSSLQKSLSVSRGTLESSVDGILVIDNNNNIIDYNHKLIEMWGISPAILKKKNAPILLEYISEKFEKADVFLKTVEEIANQADLVKIDKLNSKNGQSFEYYSQPYKQDDKNAGRIWSFRDITMRAKLEEKVQHQATHDALTELPNRVLLMDRIKQAIAKAKRNKASFGILFFDLDRFKLINDSFSHAVGDQLLQALAKRLKSSMRDEDTLARLGGDEFIAVTTSLNQENNLVKIAANLLNIFNYPFQIDEYEVLVTPSIGISVYPRDGKNVDELLRNADIAMYWAKELGGNQVQFYTEELNKKNMERMEMETDLRRALANDEFFLFYQPQFDLAGQKLVSVEALIRWQHPKKGVILPIHFISLAEEIGLINQIGEWILRTACEQNKQWHDLGLPKIRVAVNIAAKQFIQPNLAEKIKAILQETGLKPEYLELELTEKVIINTVESVSIILRLKEMGVAIALDDFGTGYSCLNYLSKIPIDRLKIDQSFIQNIALNKGDEVIIQAIIGMAKNMNLEILAEGVETQNQLDFLKSKKCGGFQGFYFSKPLSNEGITALLKNPISPHELELKTARENNKNV